MRPIKVSRTLSGRVLSLETGRIARQAHGAVLGTFGDTMVLSTVCGAGARPGIDFFPLSVDYREKTYAAGKFPGGFIKREGRPKDKEILTSRLIDRPIRPLWPEDYKDEVQILSTVLSADRQTDPDLVAMNSAFAACHLAPLPFQGPVAAVRVGRVQKKLVAFPTIEETDAGDMDIVIAATREAVVMVEGQCLEITEDEFLGVLDFARKVIGEILDMMDELREKSGVPAPAWTPPAADLPPEYRRAKRDYAAAMRKAVLVQGKHARYAAIAEVKKQAAADLVPDSGPEKEAIAAAVSRGLSELESEVMRALILEESRRIDNRGLKDVRPITIETGILPRTHGSALFTRGETQAMVVVTLGTPRDQQIVDGLVEEYSKRFDLQYNFPPYSVGEVKPVRGVGRREIGHGNLAERAMASVIPADTQFPYTIRVVSEITESNGSSSMATVCGATLALMDAGVPIRQPVAGIAMGLIKEGERVAILSDILGTEDHLGDMDFKVAGTGRGITAVQMDIKVKGISREIFAKALLQAKEGRLHILREMLKALSAPRPEISVHAPRLLRIQVPVDKIGLVIGPGGKTIKKIQDETGATIEIEDDGTVCISSVDAEAAQRAKETIDQLTAEVELGRIYQGRVVSIKDFGAFVEVLPGQEGLCHVSEIADHHVRSVGDVVHIGDVIPVKVVLRDEQGRLKLSRRLALEELGGSGPEGPGPRRERPEGGDRVDRGARPDRGPRPDRGEREDHPRRQGREGEGGRDGREDRGPGPGFDRDEGRGFRRERGPRPRFHDEEPGAAPRGSRHHHEEGGRDRPPRDSAPPGEEGFEDGVALAGDLPADEMAAGSPGRRHEGDGPDREDRDRRRRHGRRRR